MRYIIYLVIALVAYAYYQKRKVESAQVGDASGATLPVTDNNTSPANVAAYIPRNWWGPGGKFYPSPINKTSPIATRPIVPTLPNGMRLWTV
jgi:hypothetical protein